MDFIVLVDLIALLGMRAHRNKMPGIVNLNHVIVSDLLCAYVGVNPCKV